MRRALVLSLALFCGVAHAQSDYPVRLAESDKRTQAEITKLGPVVKASGAKVD